MGLKDCFQNAWQALKGSKLRSGLTLLGIVIGVSAVVWVVSFGRGQQQTLSAIFDNMGPTNIFVAGSTRQMMGGIRPPGTLTTNDYQALLDSNTSAILKVAPSNSSTLTAVYANQIRTISVRGAIPDAQQISNYQLAAGVFFTDIDLKKSANVAVLGYQTASNFFDAEDPIGKSIRIAGRSFDIIGVLEKRGGFGGPTADDFIMIPFTTMDAKFMGDTSPRGRPLGFLTVQAASIEEIPAAKDVITKALRKTHHLKENEENDFTVTDMQEILRRRLEMQNTFQLFLAFTAAVSLVVGGIGIMNIMLVSVTERTREIGICKAVGARRRDILKQFLVESALLSFGGGILGVVAAFIGAFLANGKSMGSWVISVPISMDIVLVALLVSIFTGLVSGTYPAFRAAKLDPIESLRQE